MLSRSLVPDKFDKKREKAAFIQFTLGANLSCMINPFHTF